MGAGGAGLSVGLLLTNILGSFLQHKCNKKFPSSTKQKNADSFDKLSSGEGIKEGGRHTYKKILSAVTNQKPDTLS